MTQSIRTISIFALAVLISFVLVSVARADDKPSRARAATTTRAEVKDRVLEKRIELAKDRGVREIERRDDALADLMKRVENMARLSDDEKARITALLQSQIDSLMTLKSRIEAASDLTTLKTDIRSIKDSYRVYFLTIPQTRITAAADKLKATVVRMTELAAKLETKVEEASAAGKDTARLSTLLTDLKTHLTEATANADEALRLVSSLTPDNGDAAKAEANMKALREAQAAIKAGHEDLKAARQDAGAIVKGLRELGVRDAKSSSDSDGSDE